MPRVAERRVDQILAEPARPRNALERLVKGSAAREAWTEQVRAVVPRNLAAHCQVADMRGGRLTIHVASAAWATRLRFELPRIETALRALADFQALDEIRVVTMQRR